MVSVIADWFLIVFIINIIYYLYKINVIYNFQIYFHKYLKSSYYSLFTIADNIIIFDSTQLYSW